MGVVIERGFGPEEGSALARSVGWSDTPQTTADVLEMARDGAFAARDATGALLGTATCATWDHLAWIGKMVVAPHAQRQGIGRALLRAALAHAEAKGAVSVGLDATELGRPLYETEGFRVLGESAIWSNGEGRRTTGEGDATTGEGRRAPADHAIYPVSSAEIMELLACDRARFGAPRGPFLAKLVGRHPQQCFVAVHRTTGAFSGHVLSLGERIGPLVADTPDAAARLLAAALRAGAPPKMIAAEWNPHALALVRGLGWTRGRACTRMWKGAPLPGRADAVYGVGMWALG